MGILSRANVEGRGRSLAKMHRTNLGIDILHATAQHGRPYTQDEIAVYAGCTESAIWQIEKKALRKLARRLKFSSDPILKELSEHFCRR